MKKTVKILIVFFFPIKTLFSWIVNQCLTTLVNMTLNYIVLVNYEFICQARIKLITKPIKESKFSYYYYFFLVLSLFMNIFFLWLDCLLNKSKTKDQTWLVYK